MKAKKREFEDAQRGLATLGLVLKKTDWGQFWVNFSKEKGGTEETGYYTDGVTAEDLRDAVATGKVMAQEGQIQGSRSALMVDRSAASQALDRVADHLERLRPEIPREASHLRGLALRLDRVANTLEAEQEVTERVSRIENELDDLGVDFTVAPNSEGRQSTCIYAYKGQLNSREEASVLGRIAKQHGSLFENIRNNRAYKITVPHHV